jgi:hypothetical protein
MTSFSIKAVFFIEFTEIVVFILPARPRRSPAAATETLAGDRERLSRRSLR